MFLISKESFKTRSTGTNEELSKEKVRYGHLPFLLRVYRSVAEPTVRSLVLHTHLHVPQGSLQGQVEPLNRALKRVVCSSSMANEAKRFDLTRLRSMRNHQTIHVAYY